jgi:hypothetical protein
MPFNTKQRRSLAAKLKYRHVKTRSSQGATLSYLEGWHVIAEANRIFGYDCWDRRTLSPRCVWSERQAGQVAAFYSPHHRAGRWRNHHARGDWHRLRACGICRCRP